MDPESLEAESDDQPSANRLPPRLMTDFAHRTNNLIPATHNCCQQNDHNYDRQESPDQVLVIDSCPPP